MSEFPLIDRLRQRAAMTAGARGDVALGIGDDAALLAAPQGRQLVIAVDALVDGVHVPPGTAPADFGWKALAVNLSDLAAMGAEPAAALLALALPDADGGFVDGFAEGFFALADAHRVALVGGDTTRGPLAASVTVVGYVPPGEALVRAGARDGDDVWVTGTLGDAAGALALWAAGTPLPRESALRARLDRPTPRLDAGLALRGLASACIDISDGFLADLGHVLAMSGVGADIDVDALPASAALREAFPDAGRRRALQLAGGDDYELCFTAPAPRRAAVGAALAGSAVAATRVGRIAAASGLRLHDAAGRALPLPERRGWQHFDGAPA